MNYELVTSPNPILTRTANPVAAEDYENLDELLRGMRAIVFKYNAQGLSAPQVGVDARIILVRDIIKGAVYLLPMVNPEIVRFGNEETFEEEACLSLPGQFFQVPRKRVIDVAFETDLGERLRLTFKGLTARIIQHEIDHLDGKLISDYSPL
jgi:peptide deformylase